VHKTGFACITDSRCLIKAFTSASMAALLRSMISLLTILSHLGQFSRLLSKPSWLVQGWDEPLL